MRIAVRPRQRRARLKQHLRESGSSTPTHSRARRARRRRRYFIKSEGAARTRERGAGRDRAAVRVAHACTRDKGCTAHTLVRGCKRGRGVRGPYSRFQKPRHVGTVAATTSCGLNSRMGESVPLHPRLSRRCQRHDPNAAALYFEYIFNTQAELHGDHGDGRAGNASALAHGAWRRSCGCQTLHRCHQQSHLELSHPQSSPSSSLRWALYLRRMHGKKEEEKREEKETCVE